MTPRLFSELGLSDELLKAIDKLGFEQAAPIQAAAIPLLMQGHDIVGQSQTGSGKTAAFAIPAIEKTDPHQRVVQALILCPTRELAVQVSEEVHKLAFYKRGIHALPIYGGQSYERQFYGLKQGAHIVIGTPGRVMDHMRRGTLRLETVKMVILDEVDVMLNMGFRDDIELILQSIPATRQTVFFSATIPRPIQQLIEKYSRDPQQVRIEQKAMTVPTVEQVYYEVDRRYKIELLTRLIDIHDLKLGIIFCNTKRMVDDLVDHLEAQGYMADRLHGDMTQNLRDRVMNKFRKSGLEFLVATDIAARGIDVDDVQVVFNYDIPYDAEDYVHRIGRTGRAGRSGRAISFVSGRELFQIRNIERYANTRIHRARIPTEAEVVEARENVFIEKLRATLQGGEFKRQDHVIERLLEEGFSSTDIASALLHQLQGGDAPPARTARHEKPEPERPRREPYSDQPRERPDPREPRRESRERFERPRPLDARREDRRPASPGGAGIPAEANLSQFNKAKNSPAEFRRPQEGPVRPARAVVPAKQKSESQKPEPPKPAAAKPQAVQVEPALSAEVSAPFVAEESLPAPAAGRLPDSTVEAAPAKPQPAIKPKRVAGDFTRLHMNLGEVMGILPGDVLGAIAGETGLPAKVVGTIDIRERHLFVDVASEHVHGIMAKLNRARIKGHKVKLKVA